MDGNSPVGLNRSHTGFGSDVFVMSAQPSASLVDVYGVGSAGTAVKAASASPGAATAAAMRLAFDRHHPRRLLEFSLRHRHPPPPTSHTVSASTPAANGFLDPSALCLPTVSIARRALVTW